MKPSEGQIDRAINLIGKRGATYAYFFSALKSPEWIKPLKDRGLFANPPPPRQDGEWVSFPPWPESSYLVRMASLAPSEVADVLLGLPDSENQTVHSDIARAAAELPEDLSAAVAKKEARWVGSAPRLFGRLDMDYEVLVAHVAATDAGLVLTRAILEPSEDPNVPAEPTDDPDDPFPYLPLPAFRLDEWSYRHFIDTTLDPLVRGQGAAALELFANILDRTLVLARRDREVGSDDFSYIWKPTIESGEDADHEPKGHLVAAVRDASRELVGQGTASLRTVVDLLLDHEFTVFRRIAYYLVAQSVEMDPELAKELVADLDAFDDYRVRHEFALLMREAFGLLDYAAQAALMDFIETGPDLGSRRLRYTEETGEQPTSELVRTWTARWQLQQLNMLDPLPPDWAARRRSLEAELGPVEELPFSSRSWVGPTSPRTSEELNELAVDDAIAYIASWAPSGVWASPSPEGLSRALSGAVEAEPERWADAADQLKGLTPSVVRALFSGLRQTAETRTDFSWARVLHLGLWVMQQPREGEVLQRDHRGEEDPGWTWARKELAALLAEGCGRDAVPIDMRTSVWALLSDLIEDPEPTTEFETEYEGSMDPGTMSINTTRGWAVHAIVAYAGWLFRALKEGDEQATFEAAWEDVKVALLRRCDTKVDATLTTRGALGWRYPTLVAIDEGWSRDFMAPALFPTDTPSDTLFQAGWEAYVGYCRPYLNVLRTIRDRYLHAISGLNGTSPGEAGLRRDPEERLAEHLMTFYWSGDITLEDEDQIVQRFFQAASPEARGRAIEFIGRSLRDVGPEVETLERLRNLWEWRTSVDGAVAPEELTAFGWWFVAGRFPPEWELAQAIQASKVVGLLEPDDLVVERIAKLAGGDPRAALTLLRSVLARANDWSPSMWGDSIRQALRAGLESGDPSLAGLALTIRDELGARGFTEFADVGGPT